MIDILIIAAVILLALIGIVSAVRHFRGQGGCCGGGGYRPKRKKLKNVRFIRKFKVDGMQCAHCRQRVEEVVNDICGASGKVALRLGELTVSLAEDVDDGVIISRIERAGYTVTERVE
ncbi:MAG: heavy-metal-associated domain-containing protein [Ruminococcaceae bacterium]|nr:heavy-metal-associated domain-containing protein [Oscillospiraceae bacterium]